MMALHAMPNTATAPAPGRTVRCPYCLGQEKVAAGLAPTDSVTCSGCNRAFKVSAALPFRRSAAADTKRPGGASGALKSVAVLILLLGAVGAGLWWGKDILLAQQEAPVEAEGAKKSKDRDARKARPAALATKTAVVVEYAGVVSPGEKQPNFDIALSPVMGGLAETQCDPTGKSKFAWQLIRAEGQPSTLVSVAVLHFEKGSAEPVAKDDVGGSSAVLRPCRLRIDEAVQKVLLRYDDVELHRAERPPEVLSIREASLVALSGGELSFTWRTEPFQVRGWLGVEQEGGKAVPVARDLKSPARLFREDIPSLTPPSTFLLRVTDGFSNVSQTLTLKEIPSDATPRGANPVTAPHGTFSGQWKLAKGAAAAKEGKMLCATPQGEKGTLACVEVRPGERYSLPVLPGNYRLCLPELCDACVMAVEAQATLQRDIQPFAQGVAFRAASSDACVTTAESEEAASVTLHVDTEREAKEEDAGPLSAVRVVVRPEGVTTWGGRTVSGPLQLPRGRYRFHMSNAELGVGGFAWADVRERENVTLTVDLLRGSR
ncbi:MAG: hypothetical protein ACKVPX_14350 [Myxococcaceae bacterium]